MEDSEINLLIETNKAILEKIECLNKKFDAMGSGPAAAVENNFDLLAPSVDQLSNLKPTSLFE